MNHEVFTRHSLLRAKGEVFVLRSYVECEWRVCVSSTDALVIYLLDQHSVMKQRSVTHSIHKTLTAIKRSLYRVHVQQLFVLNPTRNRESDVRWRHDPGGLLRRFY